MRRPSDLKSRILALVVFLLFLLDLGEFIAWKLDKLLGPFLHK
jgi:hypothetical protein